MTIDQFVALMYGLGFLVMLAAVIVHLATR